MLQRLNRKVLHLLYFTVLLCNACVFTGCAQFGALSESMFLMSTTDEQKLGTQLADQLRPKQVFIKDQGINDYVQGVADKVWRNAPRSEIPARFFVIQDKSINAYAIPGGNVYIQSGLINAAADEAELAAVIAHECGHVIRRHGARQASHETGVNLLGEVLLGSTTAGKNQLAQMATSILAQGSLAHYSRQDESEADEIAVKTLYRAGYDPTAMRTFFNKIREKYGDTSGQLAQLFASHPPTTERMDHVSQLVAAMPTHDGQRPIQDLRRAQGRLKQLGIE